MTSRERNLATILLVILLCGGALLLAKLVYFDPAKDLGQQLTGLEAQINTKENGVDSPDDVYEGLEIGLMFGAGFEVARIGIEGRYSYGLKSVLSTSAADDSGFGSTKLNTFSIIGKIRFN